MSDGNQHQGRMDDDLAAMLRRLTAMLDPLRAQEIADKIAALDPFALLDDDDDLDDESGDHDPDAHDPSPAPSPKGDIATAPDPQPAVELDPNMPPALRRQLELDARPPAPPQAPSDHLFRVQEVRGARALPPASPGQAIVSDSLRAFGPAVGRIRLQKRIHQERGQRERAASRFVPDLSREDTVGWDLAAVQDRIRQLSSAPDGILIVPARADSRLSGRTGYVGGAPPSPYQWAPILARFAPQGSMTWEMGPSTVPSAAYAGKVLQRRVQMCPLLTPSTPPKPKPKPEPTSAPGPGPEPKPKPKPKPELVIVPLPLPADSWSARQHARLFLHEQGNSSRIWLWGPNEDPLVVHPEFAATTDLYIRTTILRLCAVCNHAPTAKHVCVSIPMVQGLPRAVEQGLRKVLPTWTVDARYTVIAEGGGMTHVGDGRPLVATAMIVWRTSP